MIKIWNPYWENIAQFQRSCCVQGMYYIVLAYVDYLNHGLMDKGWMQVNVTDTVQYMGTCILWHCPKQPHYEGCPYWRSYVWVRTGWKLCWDVSRETWRVGGLYKEYNITMNADLCLDTDTYMDRMYFGVISYHYWSSDLHGVKLIMYEKLQIYIYIIYTEKMVQFVTFSS